MTLAQEQQQTPSPQQQWRDPTVYRFPTETEEERPMNQCDYRSQGGPLLSYIWCQSSSSGFGGDDDIDTDANIDAAETEVEDIPTTSINSTCIPQQGSILHGQSLYLGAEISSYDGCMYCIPGHADRVLQIDPRTNRAVLIGPRFNSGRKYKWLRGVEWNGIIYGLPCHADTVLKIDVPNQTISELYIHYNDDDKDDEEHNEERHREWKYHGGNISPVDGCIYTIPQSAHYVLRIDPTTDCCTLMPGPKLQGKYQFYGGVVGKADGAIYGIPHNSPQVLRIHPTQGITLHGDLTIATTTSTTANTAHRWHGGAAAANGTIVCVPANADSVLCITPVATSSEPILTLLGDTTTVQSGRHRSDGKYKYLGATLGPDGRVYCFPCAAEYVLAVDTVQMTVHQVGPNIYDTHMERLCQNKWQNGVYLSEHQCILGIPLAAESILVLDFQHLNEDEDENDSCSNSNKNCKDPIVSTWPIPAPHRNMAKWEGAVVAFTSSRSKSMDDLHARRTVAAYAIPNNHKASLRIEMPPLPTKRQIRINLNDSKNIYSGDESVSVPLEERTNPWVTPTSDSSSSSSKTISNKSNVPDRPDYSHRDDLVYKSGIPTLRASAHRVKFSPKSRKHDPCPKNNQGIETGTLWLPKDVCQEDVWKYDTNEYNFVKIISEILQRCDTDIVGHFRNGGTSIDDCDGATTSTNTQLEDFIVCPKSTWRTVNGGQCELAQKYLSDIVSSDPHFLAVFDIFVTSVVLPYLKQRLLLSSHLVKRPESFDINDNIDDCHGTSGTMTFYYQRPPTLRLQPGPAWAQVKPHNDAEYGHQYGELNFWVPLTNRIFTGVDLYCESDYDVGDYHPIPAMIGEVISFHGSSCRHFVNTNSSKYTRISFDFRVGVKGYFDPEWEMKGTNDDHLRRQFTL